MWRCRTRPLNVCFKSRFLADYIYTALSRFAHELMRIYAPMAYQPFTTKLFKISKISFGRIGGRTVVDEQTSRPYFKKGELSPAHTLVRFDQLQKETSLSIRQVQNVS